MPLNFIFSPVPRGTGLLQVECPSSYPNKSVKALTETQSTAIPSGPASPFFIYYRILDRWGIRPFRLALQQYPGQQNLSIVQHTHIHTTVLLLFWNLYWTTRVSRYQKGKTRKVKTNLDLLEQEIVSGSGICWVICKSAPHPRQPRQHPNTQFFTGWMPFLLPNQQRQSTKGRLVSNLT